MILPVSCITPVPPTNHLLPCKRKEEEIPVLQYYRQCYQQFTYKSSLNVLTKKHEKTKEKFRATMQNISTYETDERSLKPKRTSSSSLSSSLLPQGKCIFCDKTKKYKSKKAENLGTCDLKQVKEKIKNALKTKPIAVS